VVIGASMVLNKKTTIAAFEEATRNRGYLWLWGFLAILIGAVIVALNNLWTSGLPLLITILGWLALLKGILILVCPEAMISLYKKVSNGGVIVFAGLVALVFGLFLLYLGLV
jgi:hypothetical protein